MSSREHRHAALARELSWLSAREMVSSLGADGAPRVVRDGLSLPFFALSRRLGGILAELDLSIEELGLPTAALGALRNFGVATQVSGHESGHGPCLVLANHPGAYDALALMGAIGRSDLSILAADRTFLRALPSLSRHLLFVGEGHAVRASTLKRALSCIPLGGAVLHFPAGQIEPDADFAPADRLLAPWKPGVAALVRAALRARARVLVAGVRGVHSPRAKRLWLNRWAERRGVTTLSPLLQLLAGLDDVRTRVRLVAVEQELGAAPDGEHEMRLRAALLSAIERA